MSILLGISCKTRPRLLSFKKRVSDENRACSISILFFKIREPCGKVIFNVFIRSEPTKIGSVKTDRVNGTLHLKDKEA